ncbi:hypothetical protein [Citricoccus sp. NR2]|uniref:hypothetical protein n=1 Tax=Citricoccus sp. NR2 TaxID=3004095 RepID=UPI0022DD3F9F|nr:hypothetical protein [Citricoccus sp. NR2]WBL18529.1 hypothetical protein O1A05_12280 [Citricoccus sp. NR2]
MDLAQIITPIVTLIGGGIGIRFYDSWKEARQGKKLEAQAIATERDRLRRELREVYRRKQRWITALSSTQAAWNYYAIQHGTPPPTFPPTPDDDPR